MFCDSKVAEKILYVSEPTFLQYRKQNRLIEGIHWGKILVVKFSTINN